jgi:DNA-binding beta-propeller fold protein YncE
MAHSYVGGLDGGLMIIDTATFATLKTLKFKEDPSCLQFAPDGKSAYLLGVLGAVFKIDVASQKVALKYNTNIAPVGVAISPDSATLYVSENRSRVALFDAANGTPEVTIPIVFSHGRGSRNLLGQAVLTPNGRFLYVADKGINAVTMINTSSDEVTGHRILVGHYPGYLAMAPNGNYLYVANYADNTVSVVDISD